MREEEYAGGSGETWTRGVASRFGVRIIWDKLKGSIKRRGRQLGLEMHAKITQDAGHPGRGSGSPVPCVTFALFDECATNIETEQ